MKEIKLNKKIYEAQETKDYLKNSFKEFKIEPYNIDNFFDSYDSLFFSLPKNGLLSHNSIVNKSTKYAGAPHNPRIDRIIELNKQIKKIQLDIDSIEIENDLIPNRIVVQNRNNPDLKYYIQSGRRRKIETDTVFKIIKRQQGFKSNIADNDFVVLLDQSAIENISPGPSINTEDDLYIEISEINRYGTPLETNSENNLLEPEEGIAN